MTHCFGWLALAVIGAAIPSPLSAELVKRAPTCNTPTNRACWTDGFDINTDYEANFPDTGVVRNVGTPEVGLGGYV